MITAGMPAGGHHFAGWADINVAFSVVPKVFSRKRPILALRFVDYRDMRRDLFLIDDPVERLSRAIGRVCGKSGRLDIETLLGAFDHCLSCTDLCLSDGAGGLDIHDDADLDVDEIIVRIGEERWPAHRTGPLCGWIGRRDKLRRYLACRPKRRIVEGRQILLHGAAGALRIARLVPLRARDRSLLVGVRRDQARIDREPFTANQVGCNAGLNNALKHPPKCIASPEPLMTGTGKYRVT